ncbi:MAG: HAD family phosphatase [Clostridia bacterium]|nr:HAD family phosphatase [Clostridia bacterium]
MIKTVIFDFGQVLVHFEPEYMVGRYVTNEDDKKLLEEVLFDRLYWDRLDQGTISNEETLSLVKERIPKRLWDVADTIYYNWIYNIPEIDGMRDLVLYLKEKYNVNIYLLSNISTYFSSHREEIPILSLLDGCVFSGEIGIVKPSREIFEHLLNKYNVRAEECIFIDDNEKNIKGAMAVGINTYAFDGDSAKLKKYLDSILGE